MSEASARPLRIAQVAPPIERVPPSAYGGTERVVDELTRELVKRGHEVLLFASGDSITTARLVATVPVAMREAGDDADPAAAYLQTIRTVIEHEDEVDLVHGHLDFWNAGLARALRRPMVSTFHGRLDYPFVEPALRCLPGLTVAVSEGHARQAQALDWTVVHNGLTLDAMPFGDRPGDGLCFVGRIIAEKGVLDAIEVSRISGRSLRVAAKVPYLAAEQEYFDEVFMPALSNADVEYVGELGAHDRDALLASSYATLMPSDWPEPFGLTAIESLACGTPVICRPVGGLPEIIREGRDGYFGEGPAEMAAQLGAVADLDRAAIRRDVIDRFSAARMADGYEAVYRRLIGALPIAASHPES